MTCFVKRTMTMAGGRLSEWVPGHQAPDRPWLERRAAVLILARFRAGFRAISTLMNMNLGAL